MNLADFVPREIFLTKGVGKHKDQLQSFEMALRVAGIEKQNIVTVSSIIPPGCKVIPASEGITKLKPGAITFCVMSRNATNEPHRLLAASIGAAIPAEENQYGYLSENHSFGETEEKTGDYAEDLAAQMLASTLGLDINPEQAWDERRKEYRISGRIVKTTNVTQSAVGDKKGHWTTVVAAAVFIF